MYISKHPYYEHQSKIKIMKKKIDTIKSFALKKSQTFIPLAGDGPVEIKAIPS